MIDLSGRVGIVTGASRGIGRATALALAKAGCSVVVNYLNDKDAASNVASSATALGVRAEHFRADVGIHQEAERLILFAVSEFGRLDILVNNAGIWKEARINQMSPGQLEETTRANIYGTFFPSMAASRVMISQKSGNIINIASTAGQRGEALHSHYAASKGAVISLTKSLATELAPHNIRVNCVAPGWVDTDMSRPSLESIEASKILSLIPLGRVGTPDEIAGCVLFLASDLSAFVTGEILNVNGGAVLCG